jgi:hypothetical protein
MRYVIRRWLENGQEWFRTEPDDLGMERLDWRTLQEALFEVAGTMRVGDTIVLIEG